MFIVLSLVVMDWNAFVWRIVRLDGHPSKYGSCMERLFYIVRLRRVAFSGFQECCDGDQLGQEIFVAARGNRVDAKPAHSSH